MKKANDTIIIKLTRRETIDLWKRVLRFLTSWEGVVKRSETGYYSKTSPEYLRAKRVEKKLKSLLK